MTEEWINASGTRLFARSSGTGELLLLLHGFPEHGALWEHQLEVLGTSFHAVAVDGRGHGRSDCPYRLADYRIERLVADVLQVADHFGAERFILAGHDWGGLVAWFTAGLHPDRVSDLLIVNAPHPTLFQRDLDGGPEQQRASAYLAALTDPAATNRLTPDRLWAVTQQAADDQGLLHPQERQALLRSWSRPGAIAALLNWYRAAPFDFSAVGGHGGGRWIADLPIEVPTLVIWGMDDPLLRPSLLDGLDRLVPDLRIARMEGAGHSPARERPEAVTAIIADYLASRSR